MAASGYANNVRSSVSTVMTSSDRAMASVRGGGNRDASGAVATGTYHPPGRTTTREPWQAALEATEQLADVRVTLTKLQGDYERLEEDHERVKEEYGRIKGELEVAKGELDEARRELHQLRMDHSRAQPWLGRARTYEQQPPWTRGDWDRGSSRYPGDRRGARSPTRTDHRSYQARDRSPRRTITPTRGRPHIELRIKSPERQPSAHPTLQLLSPGPSLADRVQGRAHDHTTEVGDRADEEEIATIRDRRFKPDAALERSGQPKSRWYSAWSSPQPMAEAQGSLEDDGPKEDDPMGAAHIAHRAEQILDFDDVFEFRDPILERESDMTIRAEAMEDARVERAVRSTLR